MKMELELKNEYLVESSLQTLKVGKIFCSWGVFIVAFMMLTEYFTYHMYSYIFCRLLFIVPASIFLILSYTIFPKRINLIIPFHVFTLASGMLMMVSLAVIRFKGANFSPAYEVATATGGLVAVIFLIFVFSGGARKYLSLIITLPLVSLLVYFTLTNTLTWKELSFFINPAGAGLGAIVYGRFQEKLIYQEFKMRRLSEIRKEQLEKEIEERKQLENVLQKQAVSDELTGLLNRRAALSNMNNLLRDINSDSKYLTLCYIDFDNLKIINDTYGHVEGDSVLVFFAELLKSNVRASDIVARIGGDEFIVAFPDCRISEAEIIIERIQKGLNEMHYKDLRLDFSYGFAEYSSQYVFGLEELIRIADDNMYSNKLEKNKAV